MGTGPQHCTFRAVTFDMGGVLSTPPLSAWIPRWEARIGLPEGTLFSLLYENAVAERALIGQETGEAMAAEMRRQLPLTLDELAEFRGDHRLEWDTELLAFIRELRPAVRTGVISNATLGTREWAEEYVNDDTFDVILFSAEEGIAKPDPEIYRRALSRLGVAAEETIYVDDWLPNVEAACAVGMHGIYHNGCLRVQELIEPLLVPCLAV